MIENILWIIGSLFLLYLGAVWLVRGGADLAGRLGLTPLVIGLTVVAYGTSMPELMVSTKAALSGQGDLAVGNAVGSNIFNIAIILGLSAMVYPLRVGLQLLKVDTPIMLAASILLVAILWDFRISRLEAALLVSGLVTYTAMNIRLSRREVSTAIEEEFSEGMPKPTGSLGRDLGFIVGGLAILVIGSRLLVTNATEVAKLLGVSEAVIGLTIVSAGTSMPELATAIVAALKKQSDIALGNVVGSNIFNVLGILGLSGLVAPLQADGIKALDLYVMLGIAALLLPIMWTGNVLRRWEGTLLVAGYCIYVWKLWPK